MGQTLVGWVAEGPQRPQTQEEAVTCMVVGAVIVGLSGVQLWAMEGLLSVPWMVGCCPTRVWAEPAETGSEALHHIITEGGPSRSSYVTWGHPKAFISVFVPAPFSIPGISQFEQ